MMELYRVVSQQYNNILPILSLALQPLITNIRQSLEALDNRDLLASLVN